MTSSIIKGAALFVLLSTVSRAAVVTYDWNITYVNVNPDGLFTRRAIGVNGAFPPPPINVKTGDTLVVNVLNQLDVPTSLHAHGLFHTSNTDMDGAAMVSQCPIPPGANFTYIIPIEQHGTFWAHAHFRGQLVDGLRAPLILQSNTSEPYQYDEEYTVSLSDWYHQEHSVLVKEYLSPSNPKGMEPIPNSALVNHQTNATFAFTPGKTYRLRIINMSALATFQVYIDGHDMDIIEADGIDVQRTTIKAFPIAAGQRYSVLVKAKDDTTSNFRLHGDMILAHSSDSHGGGGDDGGHDGHGGGGGSDGGHSGHSSDGGSSISASQMISQYFSYMTAKPLPNATATILYSTSAPLAAAESPGRPAFDDAALLVPLSHMAATTAVDQTFTMTTEMKRLHDGTFRPLFNNITYVKPKVPTLYTALTIGKDFASNPLVYGKHSLPMVVRYNTWIEILINNNDEAEHPFHLHGHAFQVVGRSNKSGVHDPTKPYPYYNLTNPLRRDTVLVLPMSSVAIRFKADNPGVWFFHCHMEWHVDAGLAATVIEAPEILSNGSYQPIPSHTKQCEALGIPYRGNAAGNEGLNLTGEFTGPEIHATSTESAAVILNADRYLGWAVLATLLGVMISW
ncbi:hypothetical protein BGW42_000036 [Actinomortierella wolfii]|nr:hypothetical protein BGW42_000036 [Actinomortierella wolfii]